MRARLPILAVLAALGGCEPNPGSAAGGACSTGAGLCMNLVVVSDNLVAAATCLEVLGPSYSFQADTTCPTTDVVGICNRLDPGLAYALVYGSSAFTTATAAADCAARNGSFQPP